MNIFYLQMIALRAHVFFEYVSSKANIADLPSREAFDELRAELVGIRIAGSWLSHLSHPGTPPSLPG